MSFRPTIAVYINDRIADIGYYRNWAEYSLFFESVALYLIFSDCKSVEEYRQRRYGTQNIIKTAMSPAS